MKVLRKFMDWLPALIAGAFILSGVGFIAYAAYRTLVG